LSHLLKVETSSQKMSRICSKNNSLKPQLLERLNYTTRSTSTCNSLWKSAGSKHLQKYTGSTVPRVYCTVQQPFLS